MRTLLTILAGLLGLGILTYLCGIHHGPDFEKDLSGKTATALAAASIPGVNVGADGQIIILRGEVPDEETKRRAGEAAAKIWGVEEVRNLLTVRAAAAPMPPEVRQTAVSCQTAFTAELDRDKIRFATSSYAVDPSSYPLLDRLAAEAAKCPEVSFEVGGHTDPRGALEMNMALSEGRARAVVDYLVRKGVPASRMSAKGYGPNAPIADNATEAGMQQNRRTEFKVKGL